MKKKSRYMIVVCIVAVLFLLTACPHTTSNESNNNSNPSKENPDDTQEWHGGFASDQFWWGTWQRMDNGELYEISENKVKIYRGTATNPAETYNISNASTETSLVVTSLGTYTKTSDRIIELNSIPYFRKGGSNLDFSLKLVGHLQDRSADSSRAAGSVSNLKVKIKDKNHPSYSEETSSDEDGLITGKAPVAGDEMSIEIQKDKGKVVVVSGLKVDFDGANVGTVPIVEENQYALKVTGVIEEEDKTDGYLYADFTEYPLTLTITNISDIDCPPSIYEISPADTRLSIVSADPVYSLKGSLPTIPKDGFLSMKIKIRCSSFDTPCLETGINVKLSASDESQWTDFVPLKFHKGLYPINVSAVTNAKNDSAVLNAFIIYPDNTTKFFIVDQSLSGRTIFVPSFDENLHYKLVFCGATSSKVLSSSTEMFYTVAPGSITPRVVAIPDIQSEYNAIINFGESDTKNDTEETAFSVNDSFEAYIAANDKDYYKLLLSNSLIVSADRVPQNYWSSSNTGVEPITDTTAVYNTYTMVYKGTFASADSWVIYSFAPVKNTQYKIEWGDANTVLTTNYNGETWTWDEGTADICVAYNKDSENFNNPYFYDKATSFTSSTSSNYAFIKVKPRNSSGGSFFVRVTDSSSNGQNLNCEKSSGYVSDFWQEGYFENASDEVIYYNYLSEGYDYTLRWSDYWEGFGHAADIEVSASSDPDDFETASKLYFSKVNNGYLDGQTISLKKSDYVFFKISPKSSYSRYKGAYAFNIQARKSGETNFYTGSLVKYDKSTFLCDSGSKVTESNAWTYGIIYPDGYETVKFPVEKNKTYTVFWDDSSDGVGTRTSDIVVSAYKDEALTESYWLFQDSGYSADNRHTITATQNGFAYLKIRNKVNDGSGTFKIAVMHGPDAEVPLIECESHNCNFSDLIPSNVKDSDWTTDSLIFPDSIDYFYFTREANQVYKLYGKDDCNIQGNMQVTAEIDEDDEPFTLSSDAISFYNDTAGLEFIYVYPSEKKVSNTGEYGILVLDGDNKPVALTKYTAFKGSAIPSSAWQKGSLTAGDETIIYRLETKPGVYTKIFWDDKGQGSGTYTADIEVSFDAMNEDNAASDSFDSSYTQTESLYSYTEEGQIYYIKIKPKNSLANNIGTFAFAVMEGNEPCSGLQLVNPNSSFSFVNTEDLTLPSPAKSGSKYTYTIDSGYSKYTWFVDGQEQISNTNTLVVDTSNWVAGLYEITVEVRDENQYYSASDFLMVE